MRTIFIFLAICYTHFATAQIVNIPDPNFKNALLSHNPAIDTNSDNEIQVAEAEATDSLYLFNKNITDLMGIEAFLNLQHLNCLGNELTILDVSDLLNLQHLDCGYNQLTSLDVSDLVNLEYLRCSSNQLTSLVVSDLPNLQSLWCWSNQLTSLTLANLPNLQKLACSSNQLTSLEVANLPNLQSLHCYQNQFTSLALNDFPNLQDIDCSHNELTSLNIADLINLQSLDCSNNQFTSLALNDFPNLQDVNCSYNELTNLNISNLINLQSLNCLSNQLTSLALNDFPNLQDVDCSYNQLTSLNIADLINLQDVDCSYNQLTSLNIADLINLQYLDCGDNQLTSLEVADLINLQELSCYSNQLTSLDASNLVNLQGLDCSHNQLTSLFIKNGSDQRNMEQWDDWIGCAWIEQELNFSNNPNLSYICCDAFELEEGDSVEYDYWGYKKYGIYHDLTSNCQVNTYCYFEPGGIYNTISGNIILDTDNNGCDENDVLFAHQLIKNDSGEESGYAVCDNLGNYELYCNTGTYTLQPVFENPYFITPSAVLSFDTTNNLITTQNFCITANGTHHDLEITFHPLNSARPDFDAKYKIICRNKGNQKESGSIYLQFDDSVLDFVSASPTLAAQSDSLLTWSFANLQPFESRSINLTLNLNSPQETPPLNIGDVLNFLAYSDYPQTDETPNDNNSTFNQTVVDSYDPNDKTCLQGSQIDVKNIDDYLHYVIRFQNTGSAEAIQVVVKDELADNLDISTFQMVAASHDYRLRLENRILEVFFENINLPDSTTNEPESHGFVAFKIKAADSVAIGSQLKNTAEIYFDYNFPIVTNTTETAVIELSPLSVDWLYFRGKRAVAANILEWATAAEYASDFFEVQRSADGGSWSVIGKVAAAGKAHSYTFSDAQPLSGLNYYRLRQQNRDGTDDFSQMLVIGGDAADTHIFISPNPAGDFITLNSSEIIESVEIYDAAGRLRLAQKGVAHQIDVRNLASGIYTIKVKIQNKAIEQNFIKQ
ncbi:MAG: leucine-rich repeat domain-containing protein [Sphingobacteriales bacterium]|nr:leucine-rich repeat domain-containing protein [Sphingobacteriales bacterium]